MNFIHKFLFVTLILSSFATALPLRAQTDPCSTSIVGKTNSQLQADLDACNKEIERLNEVLNSTKQNTANYANEVAKLTAAINKAQANIKDKTLAISRLNSNITVKQGEINTLENRLKTDIEHLADLVRKTKRIDSYSMAEAILSEKDLSDFFVDVDSYASTRDAMITLMDSLRGIKVETEAEKAELARQRDAQAAAKAQLEASRRQVEATKKEQDALLTQSKNQEKAVASLVAEKQARAAAIRTALFGLRDAEAVPFSTALQYAEEANAKTGVRPALILAILRQESNLGANVGSCIITDLQSGQTRGVVGRVNGVIFSNGIKPDRDLPLVQSIIGGLGRDPLNTRVSCPVSQTFGYGGAMGPAQFIPSTWNYINNTLKRLTGKSVPDPWNPADAIMAAAVLLRDNGASTGVYQNERTAACKYYSGSNCYTSSGAAGKGLQYGISVMRFADQYQADIDLLKSL